MQKPLKIQQFAAIGKKTADCGELKCVPEGTHYPEDHVIRQPGPLPTVAWSMPTPAAKTSIPPA